MRVNYVFLLQNIRRAAPRFYFFDQPYSKYGAQRLFSSKSGDEVEEPALKEKGPKPTEKKVFKGDDSSKLELAKPGGMGKAGLLRTIQQDGGEMSGKKKRTGTTKRPETTSADTDDELMSSPSSSDTEFEGDKKISKDKPSEVLSPKIRHAVKDVSKSLGGDEKRTRSDLLKKLISHEKENYKASKIQESHGEDEEAAEEGSKKETRAPAADLNSILGGMKVDKTTWAKSQPSHTLQARISKASDRVLQRFRKEPVDEDEGKGERIQRRPLRQPAEAQQQRYEDTDFFNPGAGLSIFGPVRNKLKPSSPPLLPVWENLERRRLKLLTMREPRNGFEEFIRWTEEGKMLPYPVDNDYGHYELKVPFHEHVFLEPLLEDGFPATGPIRHFMELVVHGLSSNPYMTVEKKHEHIAWFRDYFKQRGAEIEKQHELDLKHQEALAAMEGGDDEGKQTNASATISPN